MALIVPLPLGILDIPARIVRTIIGRAWSRGEANEEVEKLESDVMILKAVLDEMDINEAEEIDLKRQIKEVIYDAQDVSESWAAASNGSGRRRLGRALKREINSILQHRLQPIRRLIRVYTDLKLQSNQPTKPNRVPSVLLNNKVPPIRQHKIVCFEEEEEILISYLKEETDEVDVVSIVGMPGIGKTTLAWKIYQHEDIRSEFSTRIWVDLPHNFRSKDLYLNIIKEYLKQDIVGYEDLRIQLTMPSVICNKETYLDILDAFVESGRISDGQLIYGVRVCLGMKKFLLVVDDMWTDDSLKVVMDMLPKRGKILITSCNTRVCSDANVKRKSHVLSVRNLDTSWKLLQMEVFGKLSVCPETLKSTGEVIARNCGGLPLAIAVVGARLGLASSAEEAEYLSEQWWKEVAENVMVYATGYDQQRVFNSIELRYTRLPQYLQDCFLYLGVFPQDYDIPVWTLIRLWIAEGLVQDSSGQSLEETAERNLNDLVSRSLVVFGKLNFHGEIKTCSLHTVMYGFCKYKAAEQEFYHDIKMSGGGANIDGLISLAPYHRRLCIKSHLSEFLSTTREERQVRSLLCLNNKDGVILHPKDIATIHKSFELLKIFECKGVKFSRFPSALSKLMNLRYISLSCDGAIPESISWLYYLETLVVHTESPSIEVKANIWRMLKLRHLVTKAAIVLARRGRGEAGKDLQTLTRLAPACCTKDVFTRAANLKKLGIRGDLAALSHADSLKKLERLEKLKLKHEPDPANTIQLNLDCFPSTLKRLTLSGTCLEWGSMSTLGKIRSLEILKLKNHALVGDSWTCAAADGFSNLRFLLIKTTYLKSWVASADCFPSLKHLVLNNCEDLLHLPSNPPKNLDKVDVEDKVSKYATQFAKVIKERREQRQG